MAGINHAVAYERIINIIDWCTDIAGIVVGGFLVEFLCHNNIIRKDTGYFLFQNFVCHFLKVFVNCQVNIIS